jgi:hypothetical protein
MDRYQLAKQVEKEAKVDSGVKNGANWLFAIGGLSIINSLLSGFGLSFAFVVGLGITQLIDAIYFEFGGSSIILFFFTILINIMISSVFFILGVYAKKAEAWAFIVGMIFYGFDTLLLVVVEYWFGLVFHIFGLIGLFAGYKALRALQYSNTREMMEFESSMQKNPDLHMMNEKYKNY